MHIFLKILKNNNKLRLSGKPGRYRNLCLVLTGFLLLQMIFPGAAFCMKEGNRVIQCRSLWVSPPPTVAAETSESDCCSKTCKEKAPADSRHQSSSEKHDKGSCCISLNGEHDGVICLSFSDFYFPELVSFVDPIEPVFVSNGHPLNRAAEKPSSLVFLRSVVLIL